MLTKSNPDKTIDLIDSVCARKKVKEARLYSSKNRDTLEKIQVGINEVTTSVIHLLDQIQEDMYNRALNRRNSMIYEAKNYEEMKKIANTKPGFIKVNWCGNVSCEDKIKEDLGLKSRCIIEDEEVSGPCVCCGEKATTRIYFGKQY